ncbi:MAG TPA: lipocalin family protein [Flavobacterium sp.]|uniref:lipocalin family protein n=1 Tax=Flavobacterium sp. TaxID=239 RepID=UPI002D06935D|nr:lipocalin family protein [Flavobacterium sp.]HSD13304.1 lipocalin family protein [Flavobacterium sp.]
MKRIKFLAVITMFSAALFTSCGDTEPVDPAVLTGNTNEEVAGRYKLTAFNTDVQTDLNRDGEASSNQMSETTCFNNMFLTLNEDLTFTADSKGVDISQINSLQCFTDPVISGTWTYSGSTLTLTHTEDSVVITDVLTISGDELILRENMGTIVGIPIDTPEFLSSGITMIYTKQ